MPDLEVINERPITLAELKEKLHLFKKTGSDELNFRANKTNDYLQHFCKLDFTKAKELKEKLEALDIPRLKDRHVIKIIDLLPMDLDSVKLVFTGEPITINADNMKKIADVVKEYA